MATIPSDIPVTDARSAVQQKHSHPQGAATAAQGALADSAVQPAALNEHTNNAGIHVTSAQKTTWSAKQEPIIAGANITIGPDGRTINATGGGGGGTGNIVVSDTEPVGAAEGTVWYDTSEFAGTMQAGTLAAGDTVVDKAWKFYGNPVEWAVVATTQHSRDPGYPDNACTLQTKGVISHFPYDSPEPDNPDPNFVTNGNPEFSLSNICQWLNSEGYDWWIPTHAYDAPPKFNANSYEFLPGFMSHVSEDFKSLILEATVRSSATDSVTCKAFLPHRTELSSNGAFAGRWEYMQTTAQRILLTTESAYETSTRGASRVPAGSPSRWFTRSSASDGRYVIAMSTTGEGTQVNPNDVAAGIAPAVNITKDAFIKPVSSGTYELVYPKLVQRVLKNGTWVAAAPTENPEGVKSIWSNRTVNVIGDSHTEGGGNTPWHIHFYNTLGVSKVRNYGVSGIMLSGSSGIATTYVNMDNNADLIAILIGVNDFRNSRALGVITDTGTTTFYGALNTILGGLRAKYPYSTIIFLTPVPYAITADTNGAYMSDFANAIKTACAKYSVPVVDTFANFGVTMNNPTEFPGWLPDGLHPNALGHRKIGFMVSDFLKGQVPYTLDLRGGV